MREVLKMANEIYNYKIEPYGHALSTDLTIWRAEIIADVDTINKIEEFIQELKEKEG